MALSAGTRLGVYEITALMGEGGMGQVYRARDTKLHRDVAVKILSDAFASDPDRLARFSREAQTLAALNHPNIAHIHGLEESGGLRALVMELVEGEDLAQRIARGPIPLDEALPMAKQIAEALEAAHERGIIHRDLKPANIRVREDGTVKVLDFGLAKALESTSAGGIATASPTITTPAMTLMGVMLGTAAYMSPEQAKARGADKRSDVWAFGCVLYEMLTGRRAFPGEDVSDTLASVLKSDPDWNALPSSLPPSIRSLLEGSLKKDRRDRIGDISTALFLLNQRHVASISAPVRRPPSASVWRRGVLVVTCIAIGAATAAGVWRLQPSPAHPVTRFTITLPQGQQLTHSNRQAVAVSPDGNRIAYVAATRLYVRSMAELEARAISGTEAVANPVFSPDGQSLVFWSSGDRTLKKIAVIGGVPVTVSAVGVAPGGISWSDEGILFAQNGIGIMRTSDQGSQPEVLVAVNASEGLVHGPQMLPDGHTVLFTIAQGTSMAVGDRWDRARVVAQSLETGQRKTLIDGGADGRYVRTGHLVYAVGGTLFAVPFNLAKLEVTGGAVPIVEGVRRVAAASVGTAHVAFSDSGSLVYVPGPRSWGQEELFVFDRNGGAESLKLPAGSYGYPRVSPDGKRLAFETNDGKETSISIYELSGTSSVRRLTFGGNNRFPLWSADGQRVVFQSDREGDRAVFWQSVNGGAVERLTKPDPGTSHVPESVLADGRHPVVQRRGQFDSVALEAVGARSKGDAVRRHPIDVSDHRDVFTRRPLDRLPDRRPKRRGRYHVRRAVPAHWHEASDSPRGSAAVVARRQGAVLRPCGGRIQGRHNHDAADLQIYKPGGCPPGIRDFRSCEPAAVRQHATRADYRHRPRKHQRKRIGGAGGDSSRAQLVRGTEGARADQIAQRRARSDVSERSRDGAAVDGERLFQCRLRQIGRARLLDQFDGSAGSRVSTVGMSNGSLGVFDCTCMSFGRRTCSTTV